MTTDTTPIIDGHCHAWAYWPYSSEPLVPDPETRGRVEQLLYEMQVNDVDQALIVCAQLDHNADNNAYVAAQVRKYPGKLHQAADLDSEWSATYHTPGAADRLRRMAEDWPLAAFTHYLRADDDGAWLTSTEGLEVFEAAARLNLLPSLSCVPRQLPAIGQVAGRFPSVPILIHHLGHVARAAAAPGGLGENLRLLLAASQYPNIYIKVSGFAYATALKWEYPYSDVSWILTALYHTFGPARLCWGSDYPVVRYYMTYRQSLEVFRGHFDFIPPADKARILGGNLAGLLGARPRRPRA